MIRLQTHPAYTCWGHYTFGVSEQQDYCLFIDSLKSLTYIGLSKYQNHQYRDIGNQLSATGDPRAQVIPRLRVSLVYKCSLLTCINKTNGFNGPFDGHCGCQLHIFERSIWSYQQPNDQTGTGNHMGVGGGGVNWALQRVEAHPWQATSLLQDQRQTTTHTLTVFTISVLQILICIRITSITLTSFKTCSPNPKDLFLIWINQQKCCTVLMQHQQ